MTAADLDALLRRLDDCHCDTCDLRVLGPAHECSCPHGPAASALRELRARVAELDGTIAALREVIDGAGSDQTGEYSDCKKHGSKMFVYCLACRAERAEAELAVAQEAFLIAYGATYQSHSGHWDMKGTSGANCPECIRARNERAKCDTLVPDIKRREIERRVNAATQEEK